METPEQLPPEPYETDERLERFGPDAAWLWGAGERLTWLAGIVLALSTLMGWYVNDAVALHLLHGAGIELPATIPESLVVIVLGPAATILVLIRVISIPEDFQPASRGVGLWISLVAALALIVAGLLRASEEL